MAKDDFRIKIEIDDEQAGGLLERLGLELNDEAAGLARRLFSLCQFGDQLSLIQL